MEKPLGLRQQKEQVPSCIPRALPLASLKGPPSLGSGINGAGQEGTSHPSSVTEPLLLRVGPRRLPQRCSHQLRFQLGPSAWLPGTAWAPSASHLPLTGIKNPAAAPTPALGSPLVLVKQVPWERAEAEDAQERCYPQTWHLAASGTPLCPCRGPLAGAGGLAAGFLAVGDAGLEQVRESGAVLPPPSSFHCPDSNMVYGSRRPLNRLN